ncbi:hypothetical protein LI168_11980, partial [Desulfovibrio desulfuricans]|uniref:hypothetical protein n=1 Tax=Desulfovibrio desulfuricans TaxID=876 RepID=UPI001D074361
RQEGESRKLISTSRVEEPHLLWVNSKFVYVLFDIDCIIPSGPRGKLPESFFQREAAVNFGEVLQQNYMD